MRRKFRLFKPIVDVVNNKKRKLEQIGIMEFKNFRNEHRGHLAPISVRAAFGPLPEKFVFADQTESKEIVQFENLKPIWMPGHDMYAMHFDGDRVRVSSTTNCKIFQTNEPAKKTVFQFGRDLNPHQYVLDYQFPLNAVQAFAICLSAMAPKMLQ